MKKVFVKGWVQDWAETVASVPPAHHSLPVRFKCENGSYEWLWVRRNNVTLCSDKNKSKHKILSPRKK